MEPIKISVDVNVNLSESTLKFIGALLKAQNTPAVCEKKKDSQLELNFKEEAKAEPKPALKAKPAPEPKQPAEPAPEPKQPAEPASETEQSKQSARSIEDVRAALSEKISKHREAIKQKLTELGAPSVTKLDPAKYGELYNYIESL